MADDPIPAITEAEATGATAAIFADIRAVYRVGVVNLIWRHLATIPDALPWAWGAIRPLYIDGTIVQAARLFRTGLEQPRLPLVPPEVFTALDLTPTDLTRIRDVLAAYDRTNSMALIALTTLHTPGRGVSGLLPRGALAPDETIALPVLTPIDAMPPPVAALVLRLNRFGSDRPDPILASMYRHLSHWPAYLGLAWAALAPLHESRVLHAALAATAERARVVAAGIPVSGDPPPGARAAIAPFIDDVLPKMIAICGMLRAMTTARDA